MENYLRFWGVRGSIPSSGPATAGVGGNTSCLELRLGDQHLVLDGGTGLHRLGMSAPAGPFRGHLLFGHLHWDHIQGVPFFGPLFHPRSEVTLVGPPGLERALSGQMSRPSFPVSMEVMAARLRFVELLPGEGLELGEVSLRAAALSHPGGGLAYRLEQGRNALVYACDTEHPARGVDRGLLELCGGASLLVYDAQYLPEEYPGRRGWGHSTYEQGVRLALEAGVPRLYLTHHDPGRDDEGVAEVERRAAALFPGARAAREGLTVRLAAAERREPVEAAGVA